MSYNDTVEELKKVFRELAIAKQNILAQGGEVTFDVQRGCLHMSIDSVHASFPFNYPEDVLEKLKEQWQPTVGEN